VHKFHRKGEAL